MMRPPGSQRLISREAKLARRRSYWLVARWRRLDRVITWLEAIEWRLIAFATDRCLERLGQLQEDVFDELIKRFEPMFREVVIAALGQTQGMREELTICVMNLQTLLMKEPKSSCMPELMWRACITGRRLHGPTRRLHTRFHLRALLDQLPECDARGAVRFFLFAIREESRERLVAATPIADKYDIGRRAALVLGLQLLADYLYRHRKQLDSLTAGAIRSHDCASRAAAFKFVCYNLLDD